MELRKKIEALIEKRKIGVTKRNRLTRRLGAGPKIKSNLANRLTSARNEREKRDYIDSSLRVYEQEIHALAEKSAEPIKEIARLRRRIRARTEEAEKRLHRFQKDILTTRKEMKALSEIVNNIQSIYRVLDSSQGRDSTELEDIETKLPGIENKVKEHGERLKARMFLHRIGAPLAHHNIFNRFDFQKIIMIHKEWRKKSVKEIAKSSGLNEEDAIAIARALGWPVIPESLDWWRNNFSEARVGKPVDITDWEISGVKPFKETCSRLINSGISSGKRVFAVPVYGARGGFKKWDLGDSGEIAIDLEGRHEITVSPAGVVAALLCARGENKGNIGFDELEHGTTGSNEGIPQETAKLLHKWLGLGENDTYVLMVRNLDEIDADAELFSKSLNEVVENGARATIAFGAIAGCDEWTSLKHQSHPLVRDEVLEIHHKNQTGRYANAYSPKFRIIPGV